MKFLQTLKNLLPAQRRRNKLVAKQKKETDALNPFLNAKRQYSWVRLRPSDGRVDPTYLGFIQHFAKNGANGLFNIVQADEELGANADVVTGEFASVSYTADSAAACSSFAGNAAYAAMLNLVACKRPKVVLAQYLKSSRENEEIETLRIVREDFTALGYDLKIRQRDKDSVKSALVIGVLIEKRPDDGQVAEAVMALILGKFI